MARSTGLTRDLLLKIELLSDPKWLYVVRGAVERLAETVGFAAAECRSIVRDRGRRVPSCVGQVAA